MRTRSVTEIQLKEELVNARKGLPDTADIARAADVDAHYTFAMLKEQEAMYRRRLEVRDWVITGLAVVCVVLTLALLK